jgi:iron complex outermembrane receptor protein
MHIHFSRRLRGAALTSTILTGLFVAAVEPAAAQSTADPQAAAASQPSADKDEVVVQGLRAVTATKTDTPLKEVPQSISVVTIDQIIEQGALSLQDSQRYVAGVTNAGTDTRGDFSAIRGFQSVIFLDGLKRNFGYVYLPQSEVYTLDRVDTLLGPSAVLYGAGSAGGLINMTSKRPSFQFGGEVTASYGTYDRKQAQVDLTGPLGANVAARLTAVVRNSNTLTDHLPDNRVVVQPSITWQPTTDTDVTLLGLYQRDKVGPSNFLPITASLDASAASPRIPSSRNIGEPGFDTGTKRDISATLLVDHKFSDALSFHSGTRVEHDKTSYGQFFQSAYSFAPFFNPQTGIYDGAQPYTDSSGKLVGQVPRSVFGFRARYTSVTTDNRLEANLDTGPFSHKIVAGLDYQWFKQLARQAFEATTPINIYDPVYGNYAEPTFLPQTRQTLKQFGVYVQDQIKFRDVASLVVGARHDNLRTSNTGLPSTSDNAMTYRVGLSVNVTRTLSPYALYSESFQPVAGLNQFNQSFKPFVGKSYEFGVKWQPLPTTLARATYYHIVENNHIVPDKNNPLVSIQAGKQTAKGYEFQLDHRMRRDFTLTLAYSHNSARNTGELLQAEGLPRNTASGYGVKTFELGGDTNLKIGGGVRYVGKQGSGDPSNAFLVRRVITPDFTLLDGLAEVNHGRWTLQLNATNLLDKFYYAQCSQYAFCVPGDERQVIGTLRYRL